MSNAIPSTRFSTTDMPLIDRFDAWRDRISAIFDVTRIGTADRDSFDASVTAYQIGNLIVTDSVQGEQAYRITPARVRREGIDLIQVGLYRRGGYQGDASGRKIEGMTGDLQILDLGRPMQSVEAASDMVCIFMPREALQAVIGDLDGLHGIALGAKGSRLLADYLVFLAERLPCLPEHEGRAVADETLDMIAACLRPTTKLVHQAKAQLEHVLLGRAKQFIEANLHSPRLTPDLICSEVCLSRRSLYRLFEPLDGIHHYISTRRLHHIVRALKDPAEHRRIADVALEYGFICQETFWRAFKRRYRVTPGDVRSLAASRMENAPHNSDVGFDQWLRQLHD